MKLYETTFIVDSQLKDEGWEQSIAKYSGIIEKNGSIKHLYRWGTRRLAYEIQKQTHGYYVHIIHESDPSVPRELERQFLLDETCLRYLTVLADNPKYLEEMEKANARQAAEEEKKAQVAETSPEPAAVTEPVTEAAPAAAGDPVPATDSAPAPAADADESAKTETPDAAPETPVEEKEKQ